MQPERTISNVFYLPIPENQADEQQSARCRIDISRPSETAPVPVIVWFHGGGLSGGERYVPPLLVDKGYVVVGAGYRLYPDVSCEVCLQDAAAAVAWVFDHIAEYGGDPDQIYVSGHSAGGYLSAMLGMDPRWLGAYHKSNQRLAGIAPLSGMMSTHFQIRAARGDEHKRPIIDDLAPLWHVGAEIPPLLLITGDRELDWPGRLEENLLLARTMKIAGHTDTTLYELQGYGHGMEEAGHPILLRWIGEHVEKRKAGRA